MTLKHTMKPLALLFSALCSTMTFAADVDPGLPDYERASGVSGNFSSVGSDTLANLMTLWAEEFKRFYPNVNIQIQAAGSSTAPPALTEGTANMGPMSREMKDNEIEALKTNTATSPLPFPSPSTRLRCSCTRTIPSKG